MPQQRIFSPDRLQCFKRSNAQTAQPRLGFIILILSMTAILEQARVIRSAYLTLYVCDHHSDFLVGESLPLIPIR